MQQLGFSCETPAVAAGFVVGADDAVAGDEDGEAVLGAGAGNGSGGAGESELGGDLGVGARLAFGDFSEGVPDAQLECRSVWGGWG